MAVRCAREKNRRSSMAKTRSPSVCPSPRDHHPWDHGPMTSVLGALTPLDGVSFSTARKSFRGPERSSRVEPASDEQRGRCHILHVRSLGPGLPEFVVVGMLQNIVPVDAFILEVPLVRVGQRTHPQIEIVLVLSAVIERPVSAGRAALGSGPRGLKPL